MKLSELQNKIDNAIRRIDDELEVQARSAGLDLVAIVANRVVQKGETAEGGSFTPYSTKEIPAFFFLGKSRTATAEAKVKALSKYPDNLSYKEFRAINNLNTSHKNFEFSGEMWRGFGVLSATKSPNGVTLTIGGRSEASEDRITWNSKREGTSIILPSKAELDLIKTNLNRWLNNIING